MKYVADLAIPLVFLAVFLLATFRKVPSYTEFTKGAGEAVTLSVNLFPFIMAMLVLIKLLRVSGLSVQIADFMSPVFLRIGIPKELTELVILRPFTGSGSVALVNEIIRTYGADSYIARCACVVVGSSETIFYVAAVYFAGGNVKKLRYGLPVALFSCLVGVVVACLVCKIV